MGALYLLLPISLILVVLIGAAFWWAIFSGQFEDTDEAARSILEDNDTPEPKAQEREEEKESRRDNSE
ncbi:MAG: cbb3-type cytochrome oxidase assembly protein CcoS [Alcaligenaceae bacterium]|jgi:cbb3-type cytochrome oxidase maturation protein|uniref:Cbb3-type cytochrome oxidase assembly protein CcoS n=1 Tax=Neopusillimonas maritima TaxID=2026239 RepID=A0A3A1YPD0_9BURK|nr:cbb3-type cytochrome oxidase assembly protein CcoS [Neopusillimonas maritima]MAL01919.1 cbb3-type cytochrome oxidase assembly protein CcoS [Alcaligenaceae bacterium]RIY39356.1 cbb3-type cytochrome oxidase assembly protein CcoS [Neopusillimonas maritima]